MTKIYGGPPKAKTPEWLSRAYLGGVTDSDPFPQNEYITFIKV